MILDRPERIGFEPDEALVLLIHRNLKNEYNRYLEIFKQFIDMLEEISMGDFIEVKPLKRLSKLFNEKDDLMDFIKKIVNQYEAQIDKQIDKKYQKIKDEMFEAKFVNNRPLFTEETTRRIMKEIEERKKPVENIEEAKIRGITFEELTLNGI